MYEVTLHRVVEHETIYKVEANNSEEAVDLVCSGDYDEVISDCEEGEMETPEVIDVIKI